MVKESNIAIFSLFLGFVVVFCNIMKSLENSILIAISFGGFIISLIALVIKRNIRQRETNIYLQ